MKTDTPETDEATFQILSSLQSGTEKVVHAEICAKLERERNAAREALSGRTVSCSQCNELASKLVANEAYQMGLIAERDEAREALENHKALAIHTCSQYCQRPLCVANRQIAEMHKAIKNASHFAGIILNEAGKQWQATKPLPDVARIEAVAQQIEDELQPFLKP